MKTNPAPVSEPAQAVSPFARILCGIDGSPEALEALRQAARLRDPDGGPLHVLSVADLAIAAEAGFVATQVDAELRQAAADAIAGAREALGGGAPFDALTLQGRIVPALLERARSTEATLLAVGSHGVSRAVGILLGGVATTLLHDAPCAVLVARRPTEPDRFPASIVVGFDGSPPAERALGVARTLAERFGADVRILLATGGKWLHEVDDLRLRERRLEVVPQKPTDALADASDAADLLVVGSRGVHGARALGSVSERVAHRATCSVLVVR